MLLGNVIDELHDDDRLAHAGAAEQADFAALEKRLDEVDDLDTGLKHLGARRLLVEGGSRTVNRHLNFGRNRTKLVDRFTDHVHHPAERPATHGHHDWAAQVDRLHAAHHAFGRLHGHAAHAAFAEVLLHFQNDVNRRGNVESVAHHANRGVDQRQLRLRETARRRRGRRSE